MRHALLCMAAAEGGVRPPTMGGQCLAVAAWVAADPLTTHVVVVHLQCGA